MFKKNKKYFLFVVVLLISRVLLLLSNFDIFIQDEERYNGTIAIEVIEGLKMPLFFYQHQPYAPGAMIMGVLATPFYWLFGESYLSLKCLALTGTIFIFSLWYFFIKRTTGEKCADIFSLFFILSPPNFIKFSAIALGNHYESCFFSIAVIFLMTIGVYEKKEGDAPSNLLILTAGIISGFATYYVLTFIATVILCILFWYVRDHLFFIRKGFALYLVSFAAGFSPWIYNTMKYGSLSLDFHGTPIYLAESGEPVWSKLLRFYSTGIPLSFGFEGIAETNIDTFLYYVIVITAVIFFLVRFRIDIKGIVLRAVSLKKNNCYSGDIVDGKIVLVFFPLVFSAIFIASGFSIPKKMFVEALSYNPFDTYYFLAYRYFIPLQPFAFFFLALLIFCLTGDSKKHLKMLTGYILLFVLLMLPFNSYLKLFQQRDWLKGTFYTGSDYLVLGRKIAEVYGDNSAEVYGKLARINEQYKVAAFRGAGIAIGQRSSGIIELSELIDMSSSYEKKWLVQGFSRGLLEYCKVDMDTLEISRKEEKVEIEYILNRIDTDLHPVILKEVGKIAYYRCNFRIKDDIRKSIMFLERVHERYGATFEDLNIPAPLQFGPEFWNEVTKGIDAETSLFIYRALGKRIPFLVFNNHLVFNLWIEKTEEAYRIALVEGMAETSGPYFLNGFKKSVQSVLTIPEEYRCFFIRAAGQAFFWKYWRKTGELKSFPGIASVSEDPDFYHGIGRGMGYLLWWNRNRTNDFISKVDANFRDICYTAASDRIDEVFDITNPNYYRYFNLRIEF